MSNYNIVDMVHYFEDKTNDKVNPQTDFLETRRRILYPGRFYVLEYIAKTEERFNARPVVISLGISKKDPNSFLCVDLSVIPFNARLRFVSMYFDMYKTTIMDSINKYFFVGDADKQYWMRSFNYENLCKTMPLLPIKNAIKRYKIEYTKRIYAVPFQNVYMIIGKYCDEDYYINGSIREVQNEFIDKIRK